MKTKDINMIDIINKLQQFIEDEAKSCSMDFGCITPEYVSRMWGGDVLKDEIAVAFEELKSSGFGL